VAGMFVKQADSSSPHKDMGKVSRVMVCSSERNYFM
jgi:hypothetical protein